VWSITSQDARRASVELASISVEIPENLRTLTDLGLLVGLWCQIAQKRIQVAGTSHRFRFGFLEGDVVVNLKGGRILNRDRLEVPESTIKIAKSEINQTKRRIGLLATLGLTLKWLSLIGIKINGEAKAEGSIPKSLGQQGEQNNLVWRVVNADYDIWRVSGVALNDYNVLEHRIIGKEPLCYVTSDEVDARIDIQVSFLCNLQELWFKRNDETEVIRDPRFKDIDDERNRTAIATLIVAAALNREKSNIDLPHGEGMVVLASQKLHARRTS
jgi:hypothetical protein